jgi:hypothetical protein
MSNPDVSAILTQRTAAAAELVAAINTLSEKFAALDSISARAIEAAGVPISKDVPRQFAAERLQHLVLTQLSSYATPAAWGRYDSRYNSTGHERAGNLQAEIELQNRRLVDLIAAPEGV